MQLEEPSDLLARLFDLDGEADGTSDAKQLESDPAVEIINSTITVGKRYQLGLAWKEEHKPLPTNENTTKAQLHNQL